MRAVLSVSDKTSLTGFARGLVQLGVEVFSTGGTKKTLQEAGIPVGSVSDITGFPEILDGRVKTLHPAVHGGILARRGIADHMSQLAERGIHTIDLVVVNLYPFMQTIAKQGVTLEDALENIDIGGPTMIRAAAKNFPDVIVVIDPADYNAILDQMRRGEVGLEARRKLAQKAFQHVAYYDTAIAQYLRGDEELFPAEVTIALKKRLDLSYGENPHQKAAFYIDERAKRTGPSLVSAVQLGGKGLSFNNILDLDGAINAVMEFEAPTVAIIKHTNACGLASHLDLAEAYRRALAGDPVAAYGGIVSSNRTISLACAQEINKTHFDCIVAPQFEPEALSLLARKKDMRIVSLGVDKMGPSDKFPHLDVRRAGGGILMQTPDTIAEKEFGGRVVTKRAPTAGETHDLAFAWRVVKNIKSNAIVIAKDDTLLGMGAGQPSRVVSVELALKRAGERSKGAVVGSDAFFPFSDGVELAAGGGVTAIIQPGGSVRDQESIDMADKHNIAMVFTGARHFRH
ncbi:MAG: bifunctional phosphoribosylaminoimidazolecarboxamide formyltransferase/IMP cyclohydrolase [Chloroflexi bacterium]|nr:bifunctional phosphoribosylaminoimidazolecarboxamide formyltransferase/IMP cyclohydrolase [Chloroflexota bacterium]